MDLVVSDLSNDFPLLMGGRGPFLLSSLLGGDLSLPRRYEYEFLSGDLSNELSSLLRLRPTELSLS